METNIILFFSAAGMVLAFLMGGIVGWIYKSAVDTHTNKRQMDNLHPEFLNGNGAYVNEELLAVHRELVHLNNIDEGLVYLQISRGAPSDRDFVYPNPDETDPTIVLFTQNKPGLANSPSAKKGVKIISIDDERWGRRDIKTVQLLYPSMGKMMAKKAGADDAWMVQGGYVTEGTSNNAYIIKNNKIVTRGLSNDILHGITRAAVLRFAKEAQMQVEERNFTLDEAYEADEAFITSASTFVMPVIEIDGNKIGQGVPGSNSSRLREIYLEESKKLAI